MSVNAALKALEFSNVFLIKDRDFLESWVAMRFKSNTQPQLLRPKPENHVKRSNGRSPSQRYQHGKANSI